MKLIRGACQLTRSLKGSVITIGNFDGVHLGHQALLKEARSQADALGVPLVLMSFEPHPQVFFQRMPVGRILLWRDKWRLLEEMGVDEFVCLRFTSDVATLEAEDFVHHLLCQQLGMRALVIGQDFRFGAKRRGDVALLEAMGETEGFSVTTVSDSLYDGVRVSSRLIRSCLQEGDLTGAMTLLGRPYTVSGRVVRGEQRGHELQMPTANMVVRQSLMLHGIFIVEVYGVSDKPWPGVAFLGINTTFKDTETKLEVHLIDFDGDLYGQSVTVSFLSKVRDSVCFDTVEELVEAMALDLVAARLYFCKRDEQKEMTK